MISNITEYVETITFFIIFMAFIGIITPNGKYKNYINLVLGLLLIFIIISPLIKNLNNGQLLSESISKYVPNENMQNKNISKDYEDLKNNMVKENFTLLLKKQINEIAQQYSCHVTQMSLSFDEETGSIQEIFLKVDVKNEEEKIQKKEKISIIRIEPVTVKKDKNNFNNSDDQSDDDIIIKKLKYAISDFYNLPHTNIYITRNN